MSRSLLRLFLLRSRAGHALLGEQLITSSPVPYRSTNSEQFVLVREPTASIGVSRTHTHLYCDRRVLAFEQFLIIFNSCLLYHILRGGVCLQSRVYRFTRKVGRLTSPASSNIQRSRSCRMKQSESPYKTNFLLDRIGELRIPF